MWRTPCLCALAAAGACQAQTEAARSAGIVTVVGGRAGALPTQIPASVESITGAEIQARINATDAEDALRYFPSLLVRRRYIGDYNHAVLSSRASGTGNSARSMVYADGILLSNYLGNGAAFTPRWGLVTPEEIERVDVLYGPFSAAYAGNSVGAVVDYVTRLPTQLEAHVQLGAFVQPSELYGHRDTYGGRQASASLGSREGGLAWWFNLNRLDSASQPLTFATRLRSATTAAVGTPVSGAVAGLDKSNQPWLLLGAGTLSRTRQDHAKLKLAYELPGTLRAAWTLGWWGNDTAVQSRSWLTRTSDAAPVYSGVAAIDGRNYALAAADFPQSRDDAAHLMNGLTLASHGGGVFDGQLAASRYQYRRDLSRAPTGAKPAADAGGAGRITDLHGSGWTTLAAKAVWRAGAAHVAEFGLQHERYRSRQRIDNADDWIGGAPTTPLSSWRGHTQLTSLYAQDAWAFAARWKAVLGLRAERWRAFDGARSNGTAAAQTFEPRQERWLSPKAAIGWQLRDDWSLKLSGGRAVRAPTVGELFQGNGGVDAVTNPNLAPEKSRTGEFTSQWTLAGLHRVRATLFHESTANALYTQAGVAGGGVVNSVQNVQRIRTRGVEALLEAADLLTPGLDLTASLTRADSVIVANRGYVSVPGDTVGKQQPRVPRWRATLLASYAMTPALVASVGARYGSTQYGTLNNSDANGFAYQGFSKFFTTDARLRWKAAKQWSAALGIDNLNNDRYWNFHPYPQRSYNAELRFDL